MKFTNQPGAPLQFLAVGPPRTGTSWLHENLTCVANLPCTAKETRYFDVAFDLGFEWYVSQFRPDGGRVRAEIGPTYFYSEAARRRIFAHSPQARIVCSFREPAERLYSLYKLKIARAAYNWCFEEALDLDPEMMASAAYGTHFAEWLRLYSPDRVMAVFFEDFRADPYRYLERICKFVGVQVPPPEKISTERVAAAESFDLPREYYFAHVAAKLTRWLLRRDARLLVRLASRARVRRLFFGRPGSFPKLDPELASEIRKRTYGEVELLEQLTGRDLSAWKPAG